MTTLCQNAWDSQSSIGMSRHNGSFLPDTLPDRLRLDMPLDLSGIAEEVDALPAEWWIAHFVPQHYAGSWDVLPLRAPASAGHPIMRIAAQPGVDDWTDTPELARCPRLAAQIARFDCPLGAVRLMRLAPGSRIHEHRDIGLDALEGSVRLHIPLKTDPGVDFRLNGSSVGMALGDCWYLRLADPHAVVHGGTAPRIHLVIDATLTPWLAALIARSLA